eukprot:CAMPEP_0203856500 /NCGR_PEP_ID=MMETSP0359-20131031/10213_1 /ASSEMBLY_ACC=CAM_ASM_000338 /TAXON_ID=268821 /ORGANISM="Scrippsiella Hangoei, Strain SHTV-5" /LENGTH=268 /DNA_ID=CAMNT_0050773119 /DNA_START=94 /DNA_END=900 /DNA_ORIENTATION=-
MKHSGMYSDTSQGSGGAGRGVNPWTDSHIQSKNTFLHVSEPLAVTVAGFLAVRWTTSDPTSSRSSSCNSSRTEDESVEMKMVKGGDTFHKVKSSFTSSTLNSSFQAEASVPGARSTSREWGPSASGSNSEQPPEQHEIPIEEEGRLMSIGSINHGLATSICKPCIFVRKETLCHLADQCRFCHFPHHENKGKIRLRQAKSKRDRYKKVLADLAGKISQDPSQYKPETIQLPASITKNELVKDRMLLRLQDFAASLAPSQPSQASSQYQ